MNAGSARSWWVCWDAGLGDTFSCCSMQKALQALAWVHAGVQHSSVGWRRALCSYPEWCIKQSRTNEICFYLGAKEWCSLAAFVLLKPLFTRARCSYSQRCSYSCSTWTCFPLHVDNSGFVRKFNRRNFSLWWVLGPQHSSWSSVNSMLSSI